MKLCIKVVGDGAVGKDFLCLSYVGSSLPTDLHWTLLPEYSKVIERSDGTEINLIIETLPAIEGYDRTRNDAYLEADAIIVCFAIDNRASFENVKNKWIKEIVMSPRKAPVVLVGTKRDLRVQTDDLKTLIPESEALALANKHDIPYVDCSAIWKLNLNEVFEEVLNSIAMSERPISTPGAKTPDEDSKCSIS